jgi:7-cyano-7-deazaguanine synthase
MCSINGSYVLMNGKFDKFFMNEILLNSSERGIDSSGISVLSKSALGNVQTIKQIGKYDSRMLSLVLSRDVKILINNHRAEPTTEFIKNKTPDDIQPFNSENIHIVHNGVVCNDKEYSFETKTDIDSAIIPFLLEEGYHNVWNLKGSFALAFFNKNERERLYLYRDYKPIWVCYDMKNKAYYFSSLEKYFPCSRFDNNYKIFEVPPYTFCCIDEQGFRVLEEKKQEKNNRAIVICSGGLDSVTAATHAKIIDNMSIELLYLRYGCLAENKEIESVKKVSKYLECDYKIIDVEWLKRIGGSSLTMDNDKFIVGGEAGSEYPHEWVPARNTVFISLAAAYSEVSNVSNIYMGLNLEEGGAYPDNTVQFYELFNKVLLYGTLNRPIIKNPLHNKMKWQIVKYALEINAPIHLSWSCYRGGEKPCGVCGPCYMRKKAFEMNKLKDMIDYE